MTSKSQEKNSANEFERLQSDKQQSLVSEFVDFVVMNKKWWLIPILVVLALVGLLVTLASTGAAPFIYTLF